MSNPHRAVALLISMAAVLSTAVLSPVRLLTPAGARARSSSVTMTVLSVTPSTPAITTTPRPLTITVSLLNTTATALSGVTLSAQRGSPITTQAGLTSSLSTTGHAAGKAIEPVASPKLTLAPDVAVTTTFRTTTSNQDNTGRLCLCANAVYPIDLSAQNSVEGATNTLGTTRTYIPVFDTNPTRELGVSWIWPLIDRPHRTTDGVFTDDDLPASVSGGRLDRALQVVEGVATAVPLTLVVDPDLIDELQVMAAGRYSVRASNGTVTAGTGQQAAATWLARLRAVLAAHPDVDLEFTPLADPDVTGLTQHQVTWSATLPAAVEARVTTALGGSRVPSRTVAWPPSNSATVGTLDTLVSNGANTVVLDGSQVKPSTKSGIPVSAARLRTSNGTVNAVLTSPVLQRYAQAALAGSTAALPELVSELAVRVTQRPGAAQSAVLTASRYVDPKIPSVAIQTILATSISIFSQPVTVTTVTGQLSSGTARSSVRTPSASSSGLSVGQLSTIRSTASYVAPVKSLIGGSAGSAAGRQVVATLPDVVQRSESAAWSRAGQSSGIGGGPSAGQVRTTALTAQLSGYLSAVSILPPKSGNYTLASSDSPLPISVRNDLTLSVRVRVSVSTVGGLPGFTARARTVQIPGRSKATIKIPTDIQRSGRIPVTAQLHTTSNYLLGTSVTLSVHSTVLGTIGVVITIVAGVILVLALLVRYVRRVLRLRSRGRSRESSQQHEPVP